jgi:hypothetical protein
MATSTSFKQECPSCEALVPIRDPKLVGKKIECPKCKFKFVVKEPPDEEPEEGVTDTPAKKGKPGSNGNGKVTDKKPAKAGAKKDKGDADDGDAKGKKKKKKASSNTVLIGVGLGVVAVLALGIGGYFMFFKDKKKPATPVPPVTTAPADTPKDPKEGEDKLKQLKDELASVEQQLATAMDNAQKEELNKKIAELKAEIKKTESAKTARPRDKIELAELTNLVPAEATGLFSVDVDGLWSSGVRRAALETNGAFSKDAFQRVVGFRLHHEGGEGVRQVVTATKERSAAGKNDDWVFSIVRTAHKYDQEELKKKLNLEPVPESNGQYFLVGRQFDSVGNLLFKANRPRDSFFVHFLDPQTLVFADAEPLKKFLQDRPKPDDNAAEKKEEKKEGSYQNLSSDLKELLDKVDRGDSPALFCVVGDAGLIFDVARPLLVRVVMAGAKQISDLAKNGQLPINGEEGVDLTKLFKDAGSKESAAAAAVDNAGRLIHAEGKNAAFALNTFTQEKLEISVALELRSDDTAKKWNDYINPLVAWWGGDTTAGQDRGTGMYPGGPRPPKGGMAPPGGPGGPGGDRGRPDITEPPKTEVPVTLNSSGKILAATFTIPTKDKEYSKYGEDIGKGLVRARGEADLANTAPRYHQLAEALMRYVDKNKHFPRGTVTRKDVDFRAPQNRVSWMADLLPYLQDVSVGNAAVDPDVDWFVGKNLPIAKMVVPHYVVRGRDTAFRSTYPALDGEFGVTHFVGMAGIGLDAASYRSDDTDDAVKKKIGIFGYDRVTKLDDIPKGRRDKVIALIQVPAEYRSPWMAGGGATVRGISDDEKGCVLPFISTTYKDQRGTFAIMADGKVRFISANIDAALFRSMCAINGPEKIDNFDKLVPEVPNDDVVVKVIPGEADKPGQEKPKEKPADKPADKPRDKPGDKPAVGPDGKPIVPDKPPVAPDGGPIGKPRPGDKLPPPPIVPMGPPKGGPDGKPPIGPDGRPLPIGPDGRPLPVGADGKPLPIGADGKPQPPPMILPMGPPKGGKGPG